jgi:zinc transporter ZupT
MLVIYEALLVSFLISIVSFIGIFLIPIKSIKVQNTLLSLAGSVLINDALFHLLPESLHHVSFTKSLVLISLGILLTVTVQFLSHIHHKKCCSSDDKSHSSLALTNLVNEILHNFMDGLAIGVAYMQSRSAGWSTAVAIACHEIPQEIGDFLVLKSAGMETRKLLFWNFIVSLSCPLGVFVSFMIGSGTSETFRDSLIPIACGSFLSFGWIILSSVQQSKVTYGMLAVFLLINALTNSVDSHQHY